MRKVSLRVVLPTGIVVALLATLVLSALAYAGEPQNFRAHLSGDEEVPARDTNAVGEATFQLTEGSLNYRLIVANIDNVRAAHIHCGAPGIAGAVGVTLFTGGGLGGFEGILAQGTVVAPDPGNGCGWDDLSDVIAATHAGAAYVNVHTNDGVAPTNTGPGDFPGGEIRGQIR